MSSATRTPRYDVPRAPLARAFHFHLPGVAFIRRGQRVFGGMLLLYTLAFPLILVLAWEDFTRAVVSMGLSLYLLAVDTDHLVIFWRGEVIEHWIAAVVCVGMPILLWWGNRRALRRELEDRDEHERSQWALAWREFKKSRVAAGGLSVIIILYTIVLLCPFLAPFNPNAFQDGIVTKFRPPLSTVTVLHLKEARITPMPTSVHAARSGHREAIRRLIEVNRALTDENLAFQQAVHAFHIEGPDVIATVGNEAVPIPIARLDGSEPEEFASERLHLLGTDSYGRDLLSRIIYGSRVSLTLGFIAVLLSVTLGTFVGLMAGYFGRVTDNLLMRIVDILLAFPALFLILIIIAAFESVAVPRILLIVVVLGLTSWMGISRLVRGEVLSVKEREYVLAAHALGFGHARIIFRHILPNVLTPIIVNATLRIGGIILVEAALSYLNIGVQPPTASWGNIIFEGKDVLSYAWWVSTLPGLAIVLVVVCFNLVGDGLRDAFDPMLKNERI
ncbi:MAG: ABC transporter permease [Bacteroidota bacterium]|jgi:peptide/nickel transport system permease protein|nr:ABC transporter permease [Bacteroidota bacterium]